MYYLRIVINIDTVARVPSRSCIYCANENESSNELLSLSLRLAHSNGTEFMKCRDAASRRVRVRRDKWRIMPKKNKKQKKLQRAIVTYAIIVST